MESLQRVHFTNTQKLSSSVDALLQITSCTCYRL